MDESGGFRPFRPLSVKEGFAGLFTVSVSQKLNIETIQQDSTHDTSKLTVTERHIILLLRRILTTIITEKLLQCYC